jgi:DNA phosphorothioation-dependent restriction protein DptG
MVVHIVVFKFKDENKDKNIQKAKQMLEGLISEVEALDSIEVGVNFSNEERAMDLSIITKFNSKEALKEYAIAPAHLEVIEFIKNVVEYSKVVDYHI